MSDFGLGNLVGGLINKDASRKAAGINRDMQRDFAQKGVRWKVEDAKAAGIHPLYALGASTHSFTPSFVGDQSLGNAVADMGQDISRAMHATRTEEERKQASLDLFIEQKVAAQEARDRNARSEAREEEKLRYDLEESLARRNLYNAQAAKLGPSQVGPAFPGAGPSDVRGGTAAVAPYDAIVTQPGQPTSARLTAPGVAAGVHPAVEEYQGAGGQKFYGPSQRLAEAAEGAYGWLAPFMTMGPVAGQYAEDLYKHYWSGASRTPPEQRLPPGYTWQWKPWTQSWEAVSIRRGR